MTILLVMLLVPFSTFAQTRLEFEVASIKPAPEQFQQANIGLHIDGSQVRYSYLSLKDLISLAYNVKLPQVSGPEWLGSQRFEIAAKLPDGANTTQVPEMLQSLLVDKFGLKSHRDTKEFPVYALEIAKGGLKMKETELDTGTNGTEKPGVNVAASGSAAGVTVNLGGGSYYSFANNRFEGKKLAMQRFVDILVRFMDRPVVDMTGLTGNYDFVLDVSPEDYNAMLIRAALTSGIVLPPQALRALDVSSGDSLFSALQKVGLSLTPRKAPLDVLVVDSIQKTPTNN
jgi:uncharacterized protein (TIGR03435 family)